MNVLSVTAFRMDSEDLKYGPLLSRFTFDLGKGFIRCLQRNQGNLGKSTLTELLQRYLSSFAVFCSSPHFFGLTL